MVVIVDSPSFLQFNMASKWYKLTGPNFIIKQITANS